MADLTSGYKRSLTIEITRMVDGEIDEGYPIIYNGQESFEYNGITWPSITDDELLEMSKYDFQDRFNAFKAYIGTKEFGMPSSLLNYNDADIYDITECPDETITTTTTTSTTTTTTSTTSTTSTSTTSSTTTTSTTIVGFAFNVKTADTALNACSGTSRIIYADTTLPVIGTVFYKDVNLTQVYDIASNDYILFVSPESFDDTPVQVSLVTGEILSVTSQHCTPDAQIQVTNVATASVFAGDGSYSYDFTADGYFDFEIKNIGTTPLTISEIQLNETNRPFEVTIDPTGILNPGEVVVGRINIPDYGSSPNYCGVVIVNDSLNQPSFEFTLVFDA